MKTLRIVRSEQGKDCIRFLQINDICSATEFYSILQSVFGNASTLLYSPVLCDSHGSKVSFKRMNEENTYFLTFDKKDSTSLIETETRDDIISLSSSNVKVLLPDEHLLEKIKASKQSTKSKLGDLAVKQEHNMAILNRSLNKVHSTLGSQSLNLLDYGKQIGNLISKIDYLNPHLKSLTSQLKEISQELRSVYEYQSPPELKLRVPRNFRNYSYTDPLHQSYVNKPQSLVFKDLPVNELNPSEMKRFLKFQTMAIEEVSQTFVQNNPKRAQPAQNTAKPKRESIARVETAKIMIHKD